MMRKSLLSLEFSLLGNLVFFFSPTIVPYIFLSLSLFHRSNLVKTDLLLPTQFFSFIVLRASKILSLFRSLRRGLLS